MPALLFEKQAEWSQLTMAEFETWLSEQAAVIDLDEARFETDLKDPDLAALAQKAWDDGMAAQLPGTPFLLVNGRYYGGPRDYYNLEAILQMAKLGERQVTACPPMLIDPLKQYTP